MLNYHDNNLVKYQKQRKIIKRKNNSLSYLYDPLVDVRAVDKPHGPVLGGSVGGLAGREDHPVHGGALRLQHPPHGHSNSSWESTIVIVRNLYNN